MVKKPVQDNPQTTPRHWQCRGGLGWVARAGGTQRAASRRGRREREDVPPSRGSPARGGGPAAAAGPAGRRCWRRAARAPRGGSGGSTGGRGGARGRGPGRGGAAQGAGRGGAVSRALDEHFRVRHGRLGHGPPFDRRLGLLLGDSVDVPVRKLHRHGLRMLLRADRDGDS